MKKTILCLCLLLTNGFAPIAMCQGTTDTTTTEESSAATDAVKLRPTLDPNAGAPSPASAPTVQPPATNTGMKTRCKRVLKQCADLAQKTGAYIKNSFLHPIVAGKKLPGQTENALKVCHAKALDFSDNHERDFKLIGNLTTLFGAYFFVRNSFNNFGKSTNKTVIVGQ